MLSEFQRVVAVFQQHRHLCGVFAVLAPSTNVPTYLHYLMTELLLNAVTDLMCLSWQS